MDITELMLVGLMVLLFVGPERLPQATRTLGRIYGQLRRSADELRRALVLEADRADEEHRLRELVKRRKEAEAKRRADAEVRSPPEPAPAGSEGGAPAAEPAPSVPPGFTEEEWDTLPAHVRDIVLRRQAAR